RSQVRFDTGLVVESDLLSAKVRLAGREKELIRARNNLALARAQLNTAMGVPADAPYQPADSLAERALAVAPLADQERQALTTRPDLKRIEAQQSAQELSVAIAKSSFGPRLNAFAGWEMDNPTFLAGGGGNNWLGGIELQIDLFQGGAKRAALSRERAVAEKIAALKQAANDACGSKSGKRITTRIRVANRLRLLAPQFHRPRRVCASTRIATTAACSPLPTFWGQKRLHGGARPTTGRPSISFTSASPTSSWRAEP